MLVAIPEAPENSTTPVTTNPAGSGGLAGDKTIITTPPTTTISSHLMGKSILYPSNGKNTSSDLIQGSALLAHSKFSGEFFLCRLLLNSIKTWNFFQHNIFIEIFESSYIQQNSESQ